MGESGARRAGLTTTGWAQLHHGIDPGTVPFLRSWLRLVWAIARPLKGVPPVAFTVGGAVLAVAAVFTGRWPALALVLAAVLCDALDGAVALASGRVSAFGSLADKTADRIADTAFALVIWRCGAPLWIALGAATISLVLEGTRELRRGRALAVISVCERPSRVICTVLACVSAPWGAWAPTTCAAVWIALGVVALGQVATA
jgi:CDP-diacylglycerol--glycerol-3-phosphate 3-phosphatidyltransferase